METLSIRNVANASVFRQLLMSQQTGWQNKPSDWSDIRKDCPADSIALYAAHSADYTSYDNLGFTATCTGGYKVYIDGNVYGSYSSGSTCNITWSTSGITTDDDITTPESLKAHKIWIEPATSGNNITAFRCARVSASGTEQQGILWAHFNIVNNIILGSSFSSADSSIYRNYLLTAITAKNNTIKLTATNYAISGAFANCENLEYLPVFDCNNSSISGYYIFVNCYKLPKIKFKNLNNLDTVQTFQSCGAEEIKINTPIQCAYRTFYQNRKLKKLPEIASSGNSTICKGFLTEAESLEDTYLNVSGYDSMTDIDCYGTATYFMGGFKGLRVSSSAPFTGAAPQINVSYTGMDRMALVQLFNDLPTVSSGQIINVTGTTGSEDLTAEEVAIATNKGWTVAGGPVFIDPYSITSDTLVCLPFDNNTTDLSDYSTDTTVSYDGTYTQFNDEGKFNQCGYISNNNGYIYIKNSNIFNNDELLIDFWSKGLLVHGLFYFDLVKIEGSSTTAYYNRFHFNMTGTLDLGYNRNSFDTTNISSLGTTWHHYAISIKKDDYIKVFIDGHLVKTYTDDSSGYISNFTQANAIGLGVGSYTSFDEFRVSKKCLWENDFTVPTQPYSK